MTGQPLPRACLIANRGEIAVRIVRACRELGIRTCAVYSGADARAMHVRQADAAYPIGPAPAGDSYLRIDRLLEAAAAMGCDCVHPGYGFLSESAAFAQAVIDAGLIWVGPPPAAIAAMGVKTEARRLMAAAGVPLVPGFQQEAAAPADYADAAAQIGYPVLVKAAGGGGGKGIRVVRTPADLPDALAAAQREAAHAFSDDRVFLERWIERARHIEVQVLADAHGHTVHLFERECSAQRRHQKVVEESPSPALTPAMRAAMGEAAVRAAQAVGYISAGTVEFIVTPGGEFYFLEMNTRLQVEHPVTEWVTGVDLVRLQFAIAAGQPLPFRQADLTQRGHSVEVRLYAEDAASGFLPATGTLTRFDPPGGPGVRVDAGVRAGDAITLHYDPLIAKISVHAHDRAAAIDRLRAALAQTLVLGTTTNLGFLQALIAHPAFAAGQVDTGFIERELSALLPPDAPPPPAVLIAAALSDLNAAAPAAFAPAAAPANAPDPWAHADSFRLGGSV